MGPCQVIEYYLNTVSLIKETLILITTINLYSDHSVSRTLAKDTNFLLKNGDVSLFVTVAALPHFNLQVCATIFARFANSQIKKCDDGLSKV